jgi:hypothetical protein
MNRNECDSNKGLLMGLMDQELTPEETQEINAHLIRYPNCQEEYEQLRESSGKLGLVSFREPQDAVLRKLWKSPFSRVGLHGGLLMVLGGYATLLLYAIVEMILDNGEPLVPRVAVAAMVIGFILLLLLFIRERIHTYKTDPYKHIKR